MTTPTKTLADRIPLSLASRHAREMGITVQAYQILVVIVDNPLVPIHKLAPKVGITVRNMHNMAANLQRKGFLHKDSPTGRMTIVRLSGKSLESLAPIIIRHVELSQTKPENNK